MKIPLSLRLHRQLHKDMAALQDMVLESVYAVEEKAVLHGGTAIWRCFQGNRFSEDLDFYLKPGKDFQARLARQLQAAGVVLTRFRQTQNAVYAKASHARVVVSLEIALRGFPRPVASEYEKADGTAIDVFTPSAQELLLEKLAAFRSRRLVRDIYDVHHLSRLVSVDAAYGEKVAGLLEGLPAPVDEQVLKSLVLAGAVPSFQQMRDALERRFSP